MKSHFSLTIVAQIRENMPRTNEKSSTQTAVQIGTILPEGKLNIYMKT